jgi:hypothetical protein
MAFQKLLYTPRFGVQYKVLTKEQAQEQFLSKQKINTHTRRVNNQNVTFFSNNHMFGYIDEKNKLDFVPTSFSCFPVRVQGRKGLEDGLITNIDEFIFIFESDSKLLLSEQELYEYLEQNPDAYKVN